MNSRHEYVPYLAEDDTFARPTFFFKHANFQFVGVESFVTHFVDLFPKQLYRRRGRMIFAAMYCAISYLIGLTMVTKVRLNMLYVEKTPCLGICIGRLHLELE